MKNFTITIIDVNELTVFDPLSVEFDVELRKIAREIKVSNITLMDNIVNHLQLKCNSGDMGTTEICYESYDKKIYEICYFDDHFNKGQLHENRLCTQLTYVYKKINGPAVLLGYTINLRTRLAENINADFDVLKKILIAKFFHKGVYIHHSGNMLEFIYHNDLNVLNEQNQTPELQPRLSNIAKLLTSGYHIEFSIYKYNLVIVCDRQNMEYDNKLMSLFIAKLYAKGDFIILHKVSENEYTNISIEEVKKMVVLYEDRLKDSVVEPEPKEPEPNEPKEPKEQDAKEPAAKEPEPKEPKEQEAKEPAAKEPEELIKSEIMQIDNKYMALYDAYKSCEIKLDQDSFNNFINNEFVKLKLDSKKTFNETVYDEYVKAQQNK